jgi:hypothetical protein
VTPERAAERLHAVRGGRGEHGLLGAHVAIEELLQVVEEFHESAWVVLVPARRTGGGQLVGQIAQVYVVFHQCMHASVRKALRCQREEQEFLVGGLIEDLVAEVGNEPVDLGRRPPPGAERGADGSFAPAYLVEQDGVLVRQWVIAHPVVVARGQVIDLVRPGRSLRYAESLGTHGSSLLSVGPAGRRHLDAARVRIRGNAHRFR